MRYREGKQPAGRVAGVPEICKLLPMDEEEEDAPLTEAEVMRRIYAEAKEFVKRYPRQERQEAWKKDVARRRRMAVVIGELYE